MKIYYRITFYIIMLGLFAFNCRIYSQKEIDNPNVSYDRNENNKITKIYIKGNGLKAAKAFDLYENNPYNKFKSQTLKLNKYLENNVYEISDKKVSDVIPNFNDKRYNSASGIESTTLVDELLSYSAIINSEDKKVHLAIYQLCALNNSQKVGFSSTILIVDSLGNISNKIENIDVNITSAGITIDSKYLFITYGYDNEENNVIKKGYRIYNALNNSVLINEEKKYERGFITNNLIIFGYDYFIGNEGFTEILVYDLYKKKKYMRTFPYSEQDIIEITKDGYKIGRNSGIIRLISFNKDFKSEDIK